jgi:putative ABC transport system ATP-binding protein
MVPDLDEVARPRTTRALAAGESLFEQGDASDLVYVIDEGELDIIRVLAGGDEQHLARLGPGQYCGELGPLMGFPRSASARAATDVVLTVLSPHEFRERMLRR